jgi:hypothetical protein
MTARWYIVTFVWLKPLQQPLIAVTLCRLSKSLYFRSIPYRHSNNFGSIFLNCLDHSIHKTKFLTHLLSFPFSVSRNTLPCPSALITLLLFVTVAMLSLYCLLTAAGVEK